MAGDLHAPITPIAADPARFRAAMREAIGLARTAMTPFGAVLADTATGQIVARSANRSLETADPSGHAELQLLRETAMAGVPLGRHVIVSTAEPCAMCAGAVVLAGVAGVVYGTSITTLIHHGWPQINIPMRTVLAQVVPPSKRPPFIVAGVLAAECDTLYAGSTPSWGISSVVGTSEHRDEAMHAACLGTLAPLNPTELAARFALLGGWDMRDGRLFRSYRCENFHTSIELINRIAREAERMNHHPDLSLLSKQTVQVRLWTHKLGGLTVLDFELAAQVDKCYTAICGSAVR